MVGEDMKKTCLSQEDAQSQRKWKMLINGVSGKPRFTWKTTIKAMCVYERTQRRMHYLADSTARLIINTATERAGEQMTVDRTGTSFQ